MVSLICVFYTLFKCYSASTRTTLLTPTNNHVDGAYVNTSADALTPDKWQSMDMVLYLNNDSWGFSDNSSTEFELIINGEKDPSEDISFTLVFTAEDRYNGYIVLDIFMNNDDITALNPYNKIYPFCDNASLLSFDTGKGFGAGFRMNTASDADPADGRVCDVGSDYTPCTQETLKTSYMLPKKGGNNSFPVRINIYSDPTYGWLGGYTSIIFNGVQRCNFLDSFEPNNAIIIHYFTNYGSYNITSFEITQQTQQRPKLNTTTTSATTGLEIWRSLDILLMIFLGVMCYMLVPFMVFIVTKICCRSAKKLNCYLMELFVIAFLDIIDVVSDVFAIISLFQKAECGVTSCTFTQHPAFGVVLSIATALGTIITIFKNMYLYYFIMRNNDTSDNDTQSEYADSIKTAADKMKLLVHDLPGLALYAAYFIVSATKIGIYPSTITIAAWIISCVDFLIIIVLSRNKSDPGDKLCTHEHGFCTIRKGSFCVFWILIIACIYGLSFAMMGTADKPVYDVNGECIVTLDDWSERSYYEYNGNKMWFRIESGDNYDKTYLVPLTTMDGSECNIAAGYEWIPLVYMNGGCKLMDAQCQGFYQQIEVCFDLCRLD